MDKPNILIAVPCYGGDIKAKTTSSLVDLIQQLVAARVEHSYMPVDRLDIVEVRNLFGSLVLQDGYSHLLQFDNDIRFQAKAVVRMTRANADLIGCVAPRRELDLERFATEIMAGKTLQQSVAAASNFSARKLDRSNMRIVDGIAELDGIGAGLMLVSRRVFDRLAKSVERTDNHGLEQFGLRGPLYHFFDPIRTGQTRLSEDYSFCLRWAEVGGKVHGIVDEDIGHIGECVYRAKLIDALAVTGPVKAT